MPRQLILSRRATADLDAAFRYRAARAPAAAQRWYERLRAAIAGLSDPTVSHPAAEVGGDRDIRELLFGKRPAVYRIWYEVDGDTVTVHRVLHAAQDTPGPDEF